MTDVKLEVMECSLCLEVYDDGAVKPSILSCGHTYCTSCVNKAVQHGHASPTIVRGADNRETNTRFACPSCRRTDAMLHHTPNHALRAVAMHLSMIQKARVHLEQKEKLHERNRADEIIRRNHWHGWRDVQEKKLEDVRLSLDVREAELNLVELKLKQRERKLDQN